MAEHKAILGNFNACLDDRFRALILDVSGNRTLYNLSDFRDSLSSLKDSLEVLQQIAPKFNPVENFLGWGYSCKEFVSEMKLPTDSLPRWWNKKDTLASLGNLSREVEKMQQAINSDSDLDGTLREKVILELEKIKKNGVSLSKFYSSLSPSKNLL